MTQKELGLDEIERAEAILIAIKGAGGSICIPDLCGATGLRRQTVDRIVKVGGFASSHENMVTLLTHVPRG